MVMKHLGFNYNRLAILMGAILYQPATHAIERIEAVNENVLPTVSVTASRVQRKISDLASDVQVIDRTQIQQQQGAGRKTADILAQLIPNLAPSSGTTSNFGQTLRGRQVLIMVDGVPQTGSRDVSRQLNSISPDLIERVEILSGATSIYGSGATGGIINIITARTQTDGITGRTRIGLTSGNRASTDALAYELGQHLGFKQGSWSGQLDLNLTQRGEQQDPNGKRIGPEPAQTDRQDTQTGDVAGRLNVKLAPAQFLSMGVQYYQDEQNSDYAPDYGPRLSALLVPTFQPSLAAIPGLQLADQPHTRRHAFNVQYENQKWVGHAVNVEGYYRQENSRFFPSVKAFPLNNALPAVQKMQLTTAQQQQLVQALQRSAFGVLQSESAVDVWGARIALRKPVTLSKQKIRFSYGLDYEKEQDKQHADQYQLAAFMASNGLDYQATGKQFSFGPDVTIEKTGAYIQADTDVSANLNVQGGVRYQNISSNSAAFTPTAEGLLSDLLGQYKVPYQTGQVNAGSVKHQQTLLNLGAVYHLNDNQQVFANFAQGFSLPDLQRVLRDVAPGFVVNSENVEPIKVNSVEAGWRLNQEDGLQASATAFYNTSDKVIQFLRNFNVVVADGNERIYGIEGQISLPIQANWRAGGTIAYTQGQYEDAKGAYRALNAFRVTPLKGTLFSEWGDSKTGLLRVQLLGIGGSDTAYRDAQLAASDARVRAASAVKLKGYLVADVTATFPLAAGELQLGVYNAGNTGYRTVFSQEAAATYGPMSSLPAQGRTYGMAYTFKY